MRDLAVIYGGAGVGKSSTAHHYIDQHQGSHVITMSPAYSTSQACIKHLAYTLELNEKIGSYRSDAVFRFLTNFLKNKNILLVIDEAQHLSVLAIEVLRSLLRLSGIGRVLNR